MKHAVKQVRIVHLSDLHFGDHHRFRVPVTPSGDRAATHGRPRLLEMLQRDWESSAWQTKEWEHHAENPLIVAMTGDLTETCDPRQFEEARQFILDLQTAPLLGTSITPDDIFVVPGNHDLNYLRDLTPRVRWQQYCGLYREMFGVDVSPDTPYLLTRVRDLSQRSGLVVAELNSAVYVVRDSEDEKRGQLDDASLNKLEQELSTIPSDRLKASIRIALVHHHPIILPSLAEPGRGYDAIINADRLLGILQDYGFHLVLHGHKHYPHTFSYDAVCAWTTEPVQPMMVVAGGSVASEQLPRSEGAGNTYNMITVKWHEDAGQARIRVVTRRLVTTTEYGREATTAQWRWETRRVDDRHLSPGASIPETGPVQEERLEAHDGPIGENERTGVYATLRGNMPVIEVLPSLTPGQAYEARVWLVGHNRQPQDIPEEVVWSAGPRFEAVAVCRRDDNPRFCASFEYWDAMLVQARMHFADGDWRAGYVYARIPEAQPARQPGSERSRSIPM
jgi:3',5'-cyclic AMP phosphodiesterase CpdA